MHSQRQSNRTAAAGELGENSAWWRRPLRAESLVSECHCNHGGKCTEEPFQKWQRVDVNRPRLAIQIANNIRSIPTQLASIAPLILLA